MSPRDSDRLIEIGKLGRPHGVYGAVKAYLHNQNTVLQEGMSVHVGSGKSQTAYVVTSMRFANRFHIVTLEGVEGRDQAEKLRNQLVYLPRSAFPAPDEDEFYVDDLMGLEVFEDETRLGQVKSARHQGGIEMLQVVCEEFQVDIPLVEQYVAKLDIPGGKLMVKDTEHFIKYYHKKQNRRDEER